MELRRRGEKASVTRAGQVAKARARRGSREGRWGERPALLMTTVVGFDVGGYGGDRGRGGVRGWLV